MSRTYLLCSCLLVSCAGGSEEPFSEAVDTDEAALTTLNNCIGSEVPPSRVPTYVRPPDDSVVFSTLIDGAGYAWPGNSKWVDVGAGNLCGGAEKELVLLKNEGNMFTVMRGPVPFAAGSGDLNSNPAHPWKAVAVANLDGVGLDEIVAVRRITSTGVADLVVGRADPSSCFVPTVVATRVVGQSGSSDWVDVAVGNFDGTGKQIAMLKNSAPNLSVVKLTGTTLSPVHSSNLNSSTALPWKALAAADLDGDGKDELIAARKATDAIATTIIAYKWTGSAFTVWTTNTFGNIGNGHSEWVSMAAGDFNGDGRASVVLAKNLHSNFIVLDVPASTGQLRQLATSDLDSAPGNGAAAPWRGLVAVDWQDGDQGAAELIAVRAPTNTDARRHRADVFVYGSTFHRARRDSALDLTKAQWDHRRGPGVFELANDLVRTHTNTLQWTIQVPRGPHGEKGDYDQLVDFLEATKNLCIDGRRLRVWASLRHPPDPGTAGIWSIPSDSLVTTGYNENAFFSACEVSHDPGCTNPIGGQAAVGRDYRAWGTLLGRLAQDYPHLVAVTIDDYAHHPEYISEEEIAEMQSRMRSQAPWMSLVPIGYIDNFTAGNWPDLTRTFDSLFFFFRNELAKPICLANCATDSVPRLPTELAFMNSIMPQGRKLQLGTYWVFLSSFNAAPSVEYDYRLMTLALEQPNLGGVSAYSMRAHPGILCNDFNFLDADKDFCALWKAYGNNGACTPGEVEACGLCGVRTCLSNWTWGACGSQGVCAARDTREMPCGNRCGTQVDTCSETCQWITGSCGGEGVCTPNTFQSCCPCGAQGCSCAGEKWCNNNCTWGPCSGYACGAGSCP